MFIKKVIKKVLAWPKNAIHKAFRFFYLRKLRRGFTNRSVSVFSSNCVGGCMLHDLNVQFHSPFVNLFLNAEDYLKFLKSPKEYCALDFQEIETEAHYPVASLGDLTVHFVHYKSFQEAVAAFKRRAERIDYDNLFVIFTDRDGCTYEDLKTFDRLPYQNKVVFTHVPYEDIKSVYYIEGFEKQGYVGDLIKWDKKLGRKLYDRFDFAKWLNG